MKEADKKNVDHREADVSSVADVVGEIKKRGGKELKETQGRKKLRQYIDDLLRNEHFMKEARKLFSAYNSRSPKDNDKDYMVVSELINEYGKLNERAREYAKGHHAKVEKALEKMAENYGLDMELLKPILLSMTNLRWSELSEETKESLMYTGQLDMCFFVDNYDDQINPVFPPFPLALDTRKQNHIKAFPVSIDIHLFASKRDIIDYVEKEWPMIESALGVYRDYKTIRFRKRKLKRELLDLIWENRSLTGREIKKLLDEKFPHNGLVYYQIPKIISIEKERRLGI
jgi:hypothetical protein